MTSVTLFVYDISNGLAKSLSSQLLGTHIEAIYHTSVVVFNREIFYGQGISVAQIKQTHFGLPIDEIAMGNTSIDYATFKEFLNQIKSRFSAANYHLLNFNCNTFTNEVCKFLLGKAIPSKILSLPSEFLNTPLGKMIEPMINQAFQHSTYKTSDLLESAVVQTDAIFEHKPVVYLENDSQFDSLNLPLAILMFTSSTCAPCTQIKPMFLEHAANFPYPSPVFKPPQHPTAIIVDTNKCHGTKLKFNISAVPTFVKIVNNQPASRVMGADPTALLQLFDFHSNPIPLEFVSKCQFCFNRQFNATKNKEKLQQLQISLPNNNVESYKKALNTDAVNWYPILDHLRVTLLDCDADVPLLCDIVDKLHNLTKSENIVVLAPTLLCGCRVLINMFSTTTILLNESLRNALMQLIPDLIDSSIFPTLKSNISTILKNIGVWISKRQGLVKDMNVYFVDEDDDLFLMEYSSVCCEFINKTSENDLLISLAMIKLHPEQIDLVNTIILEMDGQMGKYFKNK
eukprot:NODE_75_length_23373_cov_0.434261.p3 type:complete len:514 gc:universal NODE_75_length_23373_cov_0.434261:4363-2822(-)